MMTYLRWNKLQLYFKCFLPCSMILAGYSTGQENPSLPRYIGCYKDNSTDRAMTVGEVGMNMTLDVCRRRCLSDTQNTFMGTEFQLECYCGDGYGKYGSLPESKCNLTCGGNTKQICGGNFALSVHTVCPIGYYGQGCTERCHCFKDSLCLRRNGICPAGGCATGWKGPSCSEDIDECETNNHTCETVALGRCNNMAGSYRCECNQGYKLTVNNKCEDVNECNSGNHSCNQECINTPGSFRCTCYSGYKLMTNMRTCEDIDECALGTTPCAQECHNAVGGFLCHCRSGYKLAWAYFCNDIDECLINRGGCSYFCHNTVGSYTCDCDVGYELMSDQHRCQDIDECSTNNGGCDHGCSNTAGSYECNCNTGYQLNNDRHMCDDMNECSNTSLHTCDTALGTCTNTDGSYECGCKDGYQLMNPTLKTPLPGQNSACEDGNNPWRIWVSVVVSMLGIIVITILAYRLIGWYRKRNAIISGNQEPPEKNSDASYYENVITLKDKLKQDDTPIYENTMAALQEPLYDSCDHVLKNGLYHGPSEEVQDTQTQYEELPASNAVDYEHLHRAGKKENRKHNETNNYQPLVKIVQFKIR